MPIANASIPAAFNLTSNEASLLVKLNAAGIDAFAMGMANYLEHFPFFRDEVLPRLEAAGVR